MSRRIGITAAAATLLAVAAAHAVLWFVVTGQMLDAVPGQVRAAAALGWTLESGPARRAGWPWVAAIELADVRATRPLGGTAVRWRSERLRASLSWRDRSAVLLQPIGAMTLDLGQTSLPIEAGTVWLRVPFDPAGRRELMAQHIEVRAPGRQVSAEALQARFDEHGLEGQAAGVRTGLGLAAPFDQAASLRLRATVTPPLPWAATPWESAEAWRAVGGVAAIDEAALDWGPLHASAAGRLGLDTALQLDGEGAVSVDGAVPVLDALAQGGVLTAGQASAMRGVVALMALGAPGRPVRLPARVAGRTLEVARFPLMRLPLLDWGG